MSSKCRLLRVAVLIIGNHIAQYKGRSLGVGIAYSVRSTEYMSFFPTAPAPVPFSVSSFLFPFPLLKFSHTVTAKIGRV